MVRSQLIYEHPVAVSINSFLSAGLVVTLRSVQVFVSGVHALFRPDSLSDLPGAPRSCCQTRPGVHVWPWPGALTARVGLWDPVPKLGGGGGGRKWGATFLTQHLNALGWKYEQ